MLKVNSGPVHLEPLAAGGVLKPAEGLFFDLARPLARKVEALADLFEGVRRFFADAEVELDDLFFAVGQRVERLVDFFLQRDLHDAVVGQLLLLVLEKVHEL